MINPENVMRTPFHESHLYHKLLSMIVCGRRFIDRQESSAIFERCEVFDFDDHIDKAMIAQIEKDYEDVRLILNQAGNPQKAIEQLSGKMCVCATKNERPWSRLCLSCFLHAQKWLDPVAQALNVIACYYKFGNLSTQVGLTIYCPACSYFVQFKVLVETPDEFTVGVGNHDMYAFNC